MVDDPHEIILDHLRKLREGQSKIDHQLKDIKFPIGSLERTVAGLHETVVHTGTRLDRIDGRLERIETRLQLVEA